MTRALDDSEGMSAPDVKTLTDIERVGWHVMKVFAQPGEAGPEWAFSIGLFHTFQHPEVIVFGLPLDVCASVVNGIGQNVKAGQRYLQGELYADILQDPYKCSFREVPRAQFIEYVGYALWFYEDDPFPILQCFWPDKSGLYPWDDGCNDYVRAAQPLLFGR
jgi:hypothetical protein